MIHSVVFLFEELVHPNMYWYWNDTNTPFYSIEAPIAAARSPLRQRFDMHPPPLIQLSHALQLNSVGVKGSEFRRIAHNSTHSHRFCAHIQTVRMYITKPPLTYKCQTKLFFHGLLMLNTLKNVSHNFGEWKTQS